MKTTRKILAFLLTAALCFAMIAPAFADDPTPAPTPPKEEIGGNHSGGSIGTGGFGGHTISGLNLPRYTITIDNAVEGETYTAYKIFDVAIANPSPTAVPAETDIPGAADGTHQNGAYAYTISSDHNPWWEVVTDGGTVPQNPTLGNSFTANGLTFTKTANPDEWIVEEASGFNPATFAALLRDNMPDNPAPAYAARVTADAGEPEADPPVLGNMFGVVTHNGYKTGSITLDVDNVNGGQGYYFVDTSMGSLCSLDTTEPSATIREKNSLPTLTKTVADDPNGPFGASVSQDTSQYVYFKIDVTDGVGTDAELTVHDKMSSGLRLDHDPNIEVNTGNGGAFVPVADTNYTIKCRHELHSSSDPVHKDCTFEIVFNADFMASLNENNVIRITYSAAVEPTAVIAGAGNPNSAYLTYSEQTTPESTAIVYTYAGAIYKVDGTATSGTAPELAGATFAVTVETPAEGNTPAVSTPMEFTRIEEGSATTPAVYVYEFGAGTNTITTPASGAVVLLGLKNGTVLTLTETAAPTGFNLLASPVTLTINETHADTANKSATVTGGATATFMGAYTEDVGKDGEPMLALNMYPDCGTYQIHANSIDIIENQSGSELPSTGGIGTKIFMIGGSILILAAGVFLVAMSVSKRRSEEN